MLQRVWQKNQPILRSIVQNIVLESSSVEDVLQEAFAKLLRSRISFDTERETYNYIRRVVLNTSIDYYRSCKRRKARFTTFFGAGASSLCHSNGNPLTLLIQKEKQQLHALILKEVQETLRELPPKQKEAIDIIFNRNHQKIKDICQEKGIPYSTLRSRLTAGIDRIRDRLKARGFMEPVKGTKR